MKRFITLILSLILIFCCTACSGNQGSGSLPSEKDSSTDSVASATVSSHEQSNTEKPSDSEKEDQSKETDSNHAESAELPETDAEQSVTQAQSGETPSPNRTPETTKESSKPSEPKETEPPTSNETVPPETQKTEPPKSQEAEPPETQGAKILVVYFSATGTTRPLAEYAADILSADIYEIVPQDPYTDEDLAYYTGGRADQEQNDPSARPAISGSVQDMSQYDTILIGYPIWHGQAPKIIYTFLESYDFSCKTILPFCTSHSSGIGSSASNLHSLAPNANWLDGRRFAGGTSRDTIAAWLDEENITSN